MVEGGPALEMLREHIAARRRVRGEVAVLARELGVERVCLHISDGTMLGVYFDGQTPHADFRKADRKGRSFPRRGSAWAARIKQQCGYAPLSETIHERFGIPLSMGYSHPDGSEGWRCIGAPLNECGFLWISEDGPFAMWTPDVEAEVASTRADGYTVAEPAASFKLEFEGCRRIHEKEWEILVLQHELAAATSGPSLEQT